MSFNSAIAVAIVGAMGAAIVGWYGSLPRRTRRLSAMAEILSRLPADSTQRVALVAHVDKMVKDELDSIRVRDAGSYAAFLVAYAWGAWLFWRADDTTGLPARALAVEFTVFFLILLAAGVLALWPASWRKAKSKREPASTEVNSEPSAGQPARTTTTSPIKRARRG